MRPSSWYRSRWRRCFAGPPRQAESCSSGSRASAPSPLPSVGGSPTDSGVGHPPCPERCSWSLPSGRWPASRQRPRCPSWRRSSASLAWASDCPVRRGRRRRSRRWRPMPSEWRPGPTSPAAIWAACSVRCSLEPFWRAASVRRALAWASSCWRWWHWRSRSCRWVFRALPDRQADDLRDDLLALELEALTGKGGIQAGGRSRCDAHQHLAPLRRRGQASRDVHVVADGGQLGRGALTDGADPCQPGVDARPDRCPGTLGILVPGGAEQGKRCLDGRGRVPLSGHEREEHGDHLVTDELVDPAIVIEDHLRGDRVVAVEQRVELAGGHALRDGGGATDIGKEHGDLDLGAAMVSADKGEARAANPRILLRRTL